MYRVRGKGLLDQAIIPKIDKNGKVKGYRKLTKYNKDKPQSELLKQSHIRFKCWLEREIRKTLIENGASACLSGCQVADSVVGHAHSDVFIQMDITAFYDNIEVGVLVKKLEDKFGETEWDFNAMVRSTNINYHTGDNHKYKGIGQGTSISPILSSFFLMDFDEEMTKLAKEKGCVYARYVDDVCISGDSSIGVDYWKQLISDKLKERKLEVNEKKTQVVDITVTKHVAVLGHTIIVLADGETRQVKTSRKFNTETKHSEDIMKKNGRIGWRNQVYKQNRRT